MLLKKWKKGHRYQILPIFCPQTAQNPPKKIHQFLKLPACFEQDIFRQKLATCIRLRVRLGSGKNKKEVPAGETFVTRAVMAIKKKHCRMPQWIPHKLCREISSLLCTPGVIQYSVPFIWKLLKYGYRRPLQAGIGDDQVPVCLDFK